MKKLIPLFAICLVVLCLFSSCGSNEKQIQAKYRLQGSIVYLNPDDSKTYEASKPYLYIYHDGTYSIEFINTGKWERSPDDNNRIYLKASDTKVFSQMELEFHPVTGELVHINTVTNNPKYEITGSFYYYQALKP